MSSREPITAQQRHTIRPMVYSFWISMAALIGAVLLNVYAPGALASIGGWATVVAVWVVTVIGGYIVHLRRLRRVRSTPDDQRATSATRPAGPEEDRS